jgi:glyoxylase I family protein
MTAPATTAALLGVSHLGLSVPDMAAARDFWADVMGFRLVVDTPEVCFLVHAPGRVGVGLTDHGGTVAGPFSEQRAGLDHLALAVADLGTLEAWQRTLDDRGVPNSGIVTSDAGHHLNLRAPDDVPIELFVLDPEAAAAFGV